MSEVLTLTGHKVEGWPPNGWRYPLVGRTRQRYFGGTSLKPHQLPENAQTPTSRVHAVLGRLFPITRLPFANALCVDKPFLHPQSCQNLERFDICVHYQQRIFQRSYKDRLRQKEHPKS